VSGVARQAERLDGADRLQQLAQRALVERERHAADKELVGRVGNDLGKEGLDVLSGKDGRRNEGHASDAERGIFGRGDVVLGTLKLESVAVEMRVVESNDGNVGLVAIAELDECKLLLIVDGALDDRTDGAGTLGGESHIEK
jgi:hypothetical protein